MACLHSFFLLSQVVPCERGDGKEDDDTLSCLSVIKLSDPKVAPHEYVVTTCVEPECIVWKAWAVY